MANKIWSYGTVNGLNRQLVLAGFTFVEDNQSNPMMTVFLREQVLAPDNSVVSDKAADYSIIKGKVSYDKDNVALPKKNTAGEIQYEDVEVLLEEGEEGYVEGEENTKTVTQPQERDNAYENIKYYVDNKVFTVYELIDSGVVERFKLS